MDTYPRASIVNRSGKKGWYACVTVPPELRSLFPSKQIYKKIKGAETKQDAWDNYKKYEAIIWIEFDRANLANHPLPKAAIDKHLNISRMSVYRSLQELSLQ